MNETDTNAAVDERTGKDRPLRFVLLANGTNIPAWQAATLDKLLKSGLATLELVVVNDNAAKAFAPRRSGLKRLFGNRQLLWNLFNRIHVNRASAALAEVSLAEFGPVPILRTVPVRAGKFAERLEDEAIEEIRRCSPDFILRFGFGILHGEVLEAAAHGVWSFHHGDPEEVRGVPPGFWEILHGSRVTGVVLQRLSPQLDAGHVLHRGYFRTVTQSYAKSLDAILMGAAHFVARVCAELVSEGKLPHVPTERLGPVRRAPDNATMLRFFWRLFRNRIANLIEYRLQRQQWNIAVVDAPIHEVAGLVGPEAQTGALKSASWMPETPGRFAADPFAIPASGGGETTAILFERYDWRAGVGCIARSEYCPSGGFREPVAVTDKPSHFSYPFTLAQDGRSLCVPENADGGLVRLYEIPGNPDKAMQPAATLIEGAVLDPTIIRRDGRFWLFCLIDGTSSNTELHLFHAERLDGPWSPHFLNPVKTDVRSARPAGTIFEHDGLLFRPAQDCSRVYGGRVILNRIDRLDLANYGETPVGVCEPLAEGRYAGGLHTISAAGQRTLIDGCRQLWFFQTGG